MNDGLAIALVVGLFLSFALSGAVVCGERERQQERNLCILVCDHPESVVVEGVCLCKTFDGGWERPTDWTREAER